MSLTVSAEDYIAILDRMGRYCQHIDSGDAGAWAACFTIDGVFDGPEPVGCLTGRAALENFARMNYEKQGGKSRHHFGNMYCDYGNSSSEAVAKLYNHVTYWYGDGRENTLALCTLNFIRDGSTWLVKRNNFTFV